jgi:hypothetical protein
MLQNNPILKSKIHQLWDFDEHVHIESVHLGRPVEPHQENVPGPFHREFLFDHAWAPCAVRSPSFPKSAVPLLFGRQPMRYRLRQPAFRQVIQAI